MIKAKTEIRYIDIHGHINFPDYEPDREAVIERARHAGVGIITVGTDLQTSIEAVKLAEAHDGIWAVVGLHPTDSGAGAVFDRDAFKKLALHPKTVAIGECGLDYFHSKPEDITHQREIFYQQIALANEVGKPLMLHVRNGKTPDPSQRPASAYQEALAMLKERARVPADLHFFAGTLDDLSAATALGLSVSFTGVLTFTHDYDDLVRNAPSDRIMSETDCPFVSPVPHRGKRNEPSYVIETVRAIARIRGEEEDVVAARLLQNANAFFRLGL